MKNNIINNNKKKLVLGICLILVIALAIFFVGFYNNTNIKNNSISGNAISLSSFSDFVKSLFLPKSVGGACYIVQNGHLVVNCDSNTEICDQMTQKCIKRIACTGTSDDETSCLDYGVCISGYCQTYCLKNSDCTELLKNKCSTKLGRCVQCLVDKDCSSALFGTGATCNNQGQCVGSTPVCGDNIKNGNEDCDGSVNSKTCADVKGVGWTGTLGCYAPGTTNQCKFDTSQCVAPSSQVCNHNNQIEPPEQCDGTALGGKSCTDSQFGTFTGGTLKCIDCQFDTSQCTNSVKGECDHNTGKLTADPSKDCGPNMYCNINDTCVPSTDKCDSGDFNCGDYNFASGQTCMIGNCPDENVRTLCDNLGGTCTNQPPADQCTLGDTRCDGQTIDTCVKSGNNNIWQAGQQCTTNQICRDKNDKEDPHDPAKCVDKGDCPLTGNALAIKNALNNFEKQNSGIYSMSPSQREGIYENFLAQYGINLLSSTGGCQYDINSDKARGTCAGGFQKEMLWVILGISMGSQQNYIIGGGSEFYGHAINGHDDPNSPHYKGIAIDVETLSVGDSVLSSNLDNNAYFNKYGFKKDAVSGTLHEGNNNLAGVHDHIQVNTGSIDKLMNC